MKISLFQLSDLHLRGADDSLLGRTRELAAAVCSRLYDAQCCLVLLTGDIAWSGLESQYAEAIHLIKGLEGAIRAELASPQFVRSFVIPGNHDLDFTPSRDARDMVVNHLRSRSTGEADASTLAVCGEPQSQFFQFRDGLDGAAPPTGGIGYYEYIVEPEPGTTVRVRCLNSALTSTLREQPGQLYYPYSLVSTALTPATVDICMLHHPYNWYTPTVSRTLRDRIAAVSDLVLTGHEHIASSSSRTGSKGETNLYIEGGALQGDKDAGSHSSFNLLMIDTTLREQRLTRFDWNGTIYEGTEGPWEPYQVNQMRRAGSMVPNTDFATRLNDPGLSIDHPRAFFACT